MPERRKHPRLHLEIAVDVASPHAFFATRTRDASEGGLFIETELGVEVGTTVGLVLHLPGHARIDVDAEVAWALTETSGKTAGIGVRFLALDERGRAAISEFMREKAPMLFDTEEPTPDEQGDSPSPPPLPRPR